MWSQNYDLEAHCLYIVDDLIVLFSAVLFLNKILFNAQLWNYLPHFTKDVLEPSGNVK